MKFERGLWAETFRVIAENRQILIGFVAAQVLISILDQFWLKGRGIDIATLILFAIVAISVHSTVIKNEPGRLALSRKGVIGGFGWRLIALIFFSSVIGYFLSKLVPAPGPEFEFLILFFTIGLVYALTLCMLGTCFPAVVVSGDKSFAASLSVRLERS
jgi:hypothetical protein